MLPAQSLLRLGWKFLLGNEINAIESPWERYFVMKWHVNFRALLCYSSVACSSLAVTTAILGSVVGTCVCSAAAVAQDSADAADVAAAQARLKEIGSTAKVTVADGKLTEIVIQDGSNVTAADVALFGKLKDLTKLQIFNCRDFNDEMVGSLSGLSKLDTLAVTNSVITDVAVQNIAATFPNLVELDLSSNTNMSSSVLRAISGLTKLQRLTLLQNRFNDISTRRLSKLEDLRTLDLRGNMEAGDMTLEVLGELPNLTALKHRSTAVSDYGMEQLCKSKSLNSLLLQDFVISSESGKHLAALEKLNSLEIFRCQGFGTDGVLALKGLKLNRLTLRDLPNVGDPALAVLADLPALKRLYIHEIASLSDEGLKNLGQAKSLELLDIWSVPKMSDATIDVVVQLPNLKELSIRETGVSEAALEKILAMPKLQTLTFKNNGTLSAEMTAKVKAKKWTKLDLGS